LFAYGITGLNKIGNTTTSRQYTELVFSNDSTRLYASTKSQNKVYQYNSFSETIAESSSDEMITVDISRNGVYIISGGK
jgi:hypothetical protein